MLQWGKGRLRDWIPRPVLDKMRPGQGEGCDTKAGIARCDRVRDWVPRLVLDERSQGKFLDFRQASLNSSNPNRK